MTGPPKRPRRRGRLTPIQPQRHNAIEEAVERKLAADKANGDEGAQPTITVPEGCDIIPLFVARTGTHLAPPDGAIRLEIPPTEAEAAMAYVMILDPGRGAWVPIQMGPPGSRWMLVMEERVNKTQLWQPGQPLPNRIQ